ncbi:hypothetical protein MA16_Dca027514 [Dendrobium catenatum]|uniref:Uncharacterized protein n=1 Tax=Dendrobium catenatum TaxID=906689 RepID=A0A2I0W2Z2_9ASPA|nr:hypothetical protein MA16_Dca027514 [Dendrobium catenatum]
MELARGLIIFDSLKRNATLSGLNEMRDEKIRRMLIEGDLDGGRTLSDNIQIFSLWRSHVWSSFNLLL